MSAAREELFRQHHASAEKLTYFLLASAGTSIGFSITLQDVIYLRWPDLILVGAIIIWAISFWSGIRVILNRRHLIFANDTMIAQLESSAPTMHEFIKETAREMGFEPIQKRTLRWSKIQMFTLVAGAIALLIWRIASAYPEFNPLQIIGVTELSL